MACIQICGPIGALYRTWCLNSYGYDHQDDRIENKFELRRRSRTHHVHHVHLFASDIEKSLDFYKTHFGGAVVFDMEVAGARNIFMTVGKGKIHFYDQPPKLPAPGNIHHFGIQTDDVDGDYKRMKSKGVPFNKGVADLQYMKYVMVPAPDNVLIELFEVNKALIPAVYHDYFAL